MSKEIISKLDSIQKDITDIKIEQAVQGKDITHIEKDLEEHMRRTELAEERLVIIEDRTGWKWIKENGKVILTLIALLAALFGGLEWAIQYVMANK